MDKIAICILSGGMDSTLAAYIAQKMGYKIITIHFSYGQRTHLKELESFKKISTKLNVMKKYHLHLDFFNHIGANSLTDNNLKIPIDGLQKEVPNTYVPFRNGIFLSIATAVAEKHQAQAIYIGVVEEDSSGYPDCTDKFISSMENTINEGTKKETNLQIKMPLVNLHKKDIVRKSIQLNVPLELTWSCYQNNIKACGVCDSCRLRLQGFKLAHYKDPIVYV